MDDTKSQLTSLLIATSVISALFIQANEGGAYRLRVGKRKGYDKSLDYHWHENFSIALMMGKFVASFWWRKDDFKINIFFGKHRGYIDVYWGCLGDDSATNWSIKVRKQKGFLGWAVFLSKAFLLIKLNWA